MLLQELAAVPGVKEAARAVQAYTERHLARLGRLLQASFLLDFTLDRAQILSPLQVLPLTSRSWSRSPDTCCCACLDTALADSAGTCSACRGWRPEPIGVAAYPDAGAWHGAAASLNAACSGIPYGSEPALCHLHRAGKAQWPSRYCSAKQLVCSCQTSISHHVKQLESERVLPAGGAC